MSALSDDGVTEKLVHAQTVAAARGLSLTLLRCQVYALIAASKRPVGAYDLLAALEPRRGRRVPPTTVYRVLEFLVEHGFVHRIESKNAFFACSDVGHPHQGQFLICESCGETVEIPGDELARQLADGASAQGFKVHHQVIELSGLCAVCQREAR